MSPLSDNHPRCSCGTLGCRHSRPEARLFLDGKDIGPIEMISGEIKIDGSAAVRRSGSFTAKLTDEGRAAFERALAPAPRKARAKVYLRRVWWQLCDLGTVLRGGDPS